MSKLDIFDAIAAHEEQHFSSLLETLLRLHNAPEKFLQRLCEEHGVKLPMEGKLLMAREERTGKRRPDFLITNLSDLLVMIENKVIVESVSTDQIREELEDGYTKTLKFEPEDGVRRFVYLYIAPEPLHVNFGNLRPPGSDALPVEFTALHIPLKEIPTLFDWVESADAAFYTDFKRYIGFVVRSATMEPLDDTYASMVEALARGGLDRIQRHLADLVRMVTQIAQGDDDSLNFGRVSKVDFPANTYSSLNAGWLPDWLLTYVDVYLGEPRPGVRLMFQSDDKRMRERFTREIRSVVPATEAFPGERNFAGVSLTSLDVLRNPQGSAEDAGRRLATVLQSCKVVLKRL